MQHRLKKIATSLMAMAAGLVLCVGLVACAGGNDAEQIRSAISSTFDALKNPTEESLKPFIGEIDDATLSQMDEIGIDAYDLMEHLFAKFDYEIGEVKVDGDAATAQMTFTNVDLDKVLQDFSTNITEDEAFLEEATKAYLSESEDAKSKLYSLVVEKLYESIDGSEEVATNDMTLNLKKSDGAWDVDESSVDELLSNVFGGLDLSALV